jgi:hypothetical protein
VGWHLKIISQGVVLFTASTRSRQEIEDLAAEARRLRPDVEIFIRPPDGAAYRYGLVGVCLSTSGAAPGGAAGSGEANAPSPSK